MFFIVLIACIFACFFTAFRFPNFTSRFTSRLPRFNFARGFRNPKIKTLLQDRYYFNQNAQKFVKGSLFVVLGRNADKLYTSLANEVMEEAFALLTISKTKFLFINPALIEKKFEENFNSRIRFLINRVYRCRQQNPINGIILFPSEVSHDTLKKIPTDDIEFYADVFKIFAKKFKLKLPLFFIENDFVTPKMNLEIPNIRKVSSDFANTCDNFQFTCEENQDYFGFLSHLVKKPVDQKYDAFIKREFQAFIESFNSNVQKIMHNSSISPEGIGVIHTLSHVKMANALLIQTYIQSFLEHFETRPRQAPGSVSILNPILFADPDRPEFFKNIFDYLGANCTRMVIIPDELLEQKRRRNIVLSVVTGCVFVLSIYSVFAAQKFLATQRKEFVSSFEDFKLLVNSIKQDSEHDPATLMTTACRLVKSYSRIKNVSFRSPFLFPSWWSNFSERTQKKYKDKLSLTYSDILIQKYDSVLNSEIKFKTPNSNESVKTIYLSFKDYVEFMTGYHTIYEQLISGDPTKINDGLIRMSKIIYEDKCFENVKSEGFLSTLEKKRFAELVGEYDTVKAEATNVLKLHAEQYFSTILGKNNLLNGALKIQNDMQRFNFIVNSIAKKTGDHSDDSAASIRKAFSEMRETYKLIAQDFSENQVRSLASAKEFFGPEFYGTLDKIHKSALFDSKIFDEINAMAERTYVSFKEQIQTLTTQNDDTDNFLVVLRDDKSSLSLNPKAVVLFATLESMNSSDPAMKSRDDNGRAWDLGLKPSLNSVSNASWSEHKLQTILQRNASFQTNYNVLDFNDYPEKFSEYLQDYIATYSDEYWSQALPFALISDDNFDQDSSPDPYGLVSSAPALKKIAVILADQNAENALTMFDDIYMRQIDDVLRRKHLLLERKGFFGSDMKDLSWWDGKTSPSYGVFHVSSNESLKEILEKQKFNLSEFYSQNIDKLIKSILPVMQERQNLRSFYFERWLSIQLALEDKSSSFQNFSNFVQNNFTAFRLDDCPEILAKSKMASIVPNYFDARVEDLYGILNERCRVIYMQTALTAYQDFAKAFNGLLAGKYPFSQVGTSSSSLVQTVELDDLANVLDQFQDLLKGKTDFLFKYSNQFQTQSELKTFVSQMIAVNSFFHLKKEDSVAFSSPVEVIFNYRSRRNDEVLANHIVDWSLKVNEKLYGSLYGNAQNARFAWNYGEPISLKLSFSKDVTLKSVGLSYSKSAEYVADNTISYIFGGQFSLLKFLDEYRTCMPGKEYCSREKLRFEIPLSNQKTAILFCDIILLGADGKRITIPDFPIKAPYVIF